MLWLGRGFSPRGMANILWQGAFIPDKTFSPVLLKYSWIVNQTAIHEGVGSAHNLALPSIEHCVVSRRDPLLQHTSMCKSLRETCLGVCMENLHYLSHILCFPAVVQNGDNAIIFDYFYIQACRLLCNQLHGHFSPFRLLPLNVLQYRLCDQVVN